MDIVIHQLDGEYIDDDDMLPRFLLFEASNLRACSCCPAWSMKLIGSRRSIEDIPWQHDDHWVACGKAGGVSWLP